MSNGLRIYYCNWVRITNNKTNDADLALMLKTIKRHVTPLTMTKSSGLQSIYIFITEKLWNEDSIIAVKKYYNFRSSDLSQKQRETSSATVIYGVSQ